MDSKTVINNAMAASNFSLESISSHLNSIGIYSCVEDLNFAISNNNLKVYELEQILNTMGFNISFTKMDVEKDIEKFISNILSYDRRERIAVLLNNQNVPCTYKIQLRNTLFNHNNNKPTEDICNDFETASINYLRDYNLL